MPILAIDTATMVSSVAVADEKKLLGELTVQTRLTHSETLSVLHIIDLPAPVSGMILLMMSWPQIVTGTIGLLLAKRVFKYLENTIL